MVQVDETKANILGATGYVWVFAAQADVAFVYTGGRDGSIVGRVLEGFRGVLVSDFYAAYDSRSRHAGSHDVGRLVMIPMRERERERRGIEDPRPLEAQGFGQPLLSGAIVRQFPSPQRLRSNAPQIDLIEERR